MTNCFKINLEELVGINARMHSGNSFQLSSFNKVFICIFL